MTNQNQIEVPYNFTFRDYQKSLWQASFEKKRLIYIWHRRAGKDLFALNRLLYAMVFEQVGTYWHIFPTYAQGKKSIWQETDISGRKYIDYIPSQLIKQKNESELKITLKNGSIYQIVGSDNPDNLRGAGIKGCCFSEYAEQDPRAWETIEPMLRATGGFALFNFTPKGQNHSYDLFNMAQKLQDTWHTEIKTVEDTKAIDLKELEQVKNELILRGKTLDFFNQEYYCSFTNPIEGAYYSDLIQELEKKGKIGKFEYERNLQVSTFWDLGVGDATAIWFAQFIGNEVRIIDYFEANGKGLDYYIKELKNKVYVYNRHYAPHDIQVREFSNGKSRIETALELGLRFNIAPRLSIDDGIDATRAILTKCYFNEETTRAGLNALRNYKKEFDFKNNTFKLQPKHDWTSHGSDAFRYLAVSYRQDFGQQSRRQADFADDRIINY